MPDKSVLEDVVVVNLRLNEQHFVSLISVQQACVQVILVGRLARLLHGMQQVRQHG